jgi:hypothetical protein
LRVLETEVLRKVGPKREEAICGWRKLYSNEVHNFDWQPEMMRVIKKG